MSNYRRLDWEYTCRSAINHIHIKAAEPRKAAEWWVAAFGFKILSVETTPFAEVERILKKEGAS